jgi:L-amino acid N-acyltransferase YncA
MLSVRLATPGDAPAVAAIYAPIVRDTTISFELEPPDVDEFARRIATTLPAHPWLIAEEAGRVMGYAYAGPHRSRAAYRWSVEVSVYVDADARRRGVARELYTALFSVLRAQGFANAYAGVTLPNEPSLRLHRAFGFEEVGVYRRVGYKQGRWRDVWWGALDLAPSREGDPPPPRLLGGLEATGELAAALDAGR